MVEKWVFIAKIYGQLTKQHRFGKKTTTNSSFLPQFDGFRIRRVVLELNVLNPEYAGSRKFPLCHQALPRPQVIVSSVPVFPISRRLCLGSMIYC